MEAELDPGIRCTVEWLRLRRFVTIDSGDGVTKPGPDYPDALAVPHVFMRVDDVHQLGSEALRLYSSLGMHGIAVMPQGEGPIYIEASFDPVNKIAVIGLFGVNDALLSGETEQDGQTDPVAR